MEFVDTHCHIQEAFEYDGDADSSVHNRWQIAGRTNVDEIINDANDASVTRLLCVGTTLADSRRALELAQSKEGVWASIGIHPHEAKEYIGKTKKLRDFAELASTPKVVAIGECGLDYFYNHSEKSAQIELLHFQIQLALEHHLPLVFHIRNAFDDFWKVADKYRELRGVVHSFSAGRKEAAEILDRGFLFGLNGIMTFTKIDEQLEAVKGLPLEKIVLETDAPFLTPIPYRGRICEPKHVRTTAEFLANLRGESLEEFAKATTRNARNLFRI